MHYLFWTPTFTDRFPFIVPRLADLSDVVNKYPGPTEPIPGMFPFMPYVPLGLVFAGVLFLSARLRKDPDLPVMGGILTAGMLVLGFLCTFWVVCPRYVHDYLGLLALVAATGIEKFAAATESLGISRVAYRLGMLLPTGYSLLVGALLGFYSIY